ncbi:MAG: helix-turn-helix domain-containing protein [Actinomycetota bacterium]
MDMPERSFGRTVRYRRTKLGMSQAKLADLVGRTATTIRAWERDKSRPNDPKVLSALAAVLGVDERHLFDKAGVEPPETETSPTVEQALATLAFKDVVDAGGGDTRNDQDDQPQPEPEKEPESEPEHEPVAPVSSEERERRPSVERQLQSVGANQPAYAAPPDPFERGPVTPTTADLSYMEDDSQRQLYRVRNLATLVAFVALVIAFLWALGEGLGALGEWWDDFVANLRL